MSQRLLLAASRVPLHELLHLPFSTNVVRLRLLGGAYLEADDGPVHGRGAQRRRLALLALLGATPRSITRDKLIGYVWPENETDRARRLLNESIYVLRKTLGEEALVSEGDEVRLDGVHVWCDVRAFDVAIESEDLETAVELYRGPFLDGFFLSEAEEFERWVDVERERLAQRHTRALRTLAERKLEEGDPDDATEWWRRLSAHDPYSSATALGLMRSLEAAGDRAGALQHAREYGELLKTEFQADPDPEVLAMVEQLRRPAMPSARPVESPRGPMPFQLPAPLPVTDPPVAHADPAGPASMVTGESTSAPRPTRARRRWTIPALLAAAALAAFGIWRASADDPAPAAATPTLRRIAVLPFTVSGANELDVWRTGLPRLISANLDGAGPYRAVDTNMLLSWLSRRGGPPDISAGKAAARRFGAQKFLLGNAVVDAAGRIRLTAYLYEPEQAEAQLTIFAEGSADSVVDLVTRLTADLLAARVGGDDDDLRRLALGMTRSPTAIKAYLAGEDSFRVARYEDAAVLFRRAVREDPSFALAYYRLSAAAEWSYDFVGARQAAQDARSHASGRLTGRRLQLLNAWQEFLEGDAEQAEARLAAILAEREHDAEARAVLGEVLVHHNPVRGELARDAAAEFQQLLSDDPSYTEARFHLLEFAAAERDSVGLDSLLAGLPAGHEQTLAWQAVRAFGWGTAADRTRVLRAMGTAEERAAGLAVARVAAHLRDFDAAEMLATSLMERTKGAWHAGAQLMSAQIALGAGKRQRAIEQFAAARTEERDWALELEALAVLFPVAEPSREQLTALRDELTRWDPGARTPSHTFFFLAHWQIHAKLRLYLRALVSARLGDTVSAQLLADTLRRSGGDRTTKPVAVQLSNSVRGHIARAQGQLEHAAQLLDSAHIESGPDEISVSPFLSRAHDRFVLAEVLVELGRPEEAQKWYRSLTQGTDFQYVAAAHVRLAAIAHERGDSAGAQHHRKTAARLWRNADPAMVSLIGSSM